MKAAAWAGSVRARRVAGVGAGVVLIALLTGARGPGTGSAEAFVKPAVVPLRVSALPDVFSDAALQVARPAGSSGDKTPAVGSLDWSEIPPPALNAYRRAALIMQNSAPGCGLTWEILAGIGRVESDHGRFAGAIVNADGTTTPRIYGVALNGVGDVAAISDSENGTLDGDPEWDRAVGPMQFLPTTWDVVGVDADGDGVANPHDLDDAALASGVYLCAGDVDLRDRDQLKQALWRYNPSSEYVSLVLSYIDAYRRGETVPTSPVDTPIDKVETLDEAPDKPVHPSTSQPEDKPRPTDGSDGQQQNGPHSPPDKPPVDEPPDRPPPDDTNPPPDDTDPPPDDTDPPPDDTDPPPDDTDPPPDSDPEPEPELVVLTGVLEQSETGWYVGETLLDLGPAEQIQGPASADYDADGTTETVAAELDGLRGLEVTLEVELAGRTAVVYTIQDLVYRSDDAAPASGETG